MTPCQTPCRQRGAVEPRLLGYVLIGAGLLINRWTLGALFASDGTIDGEFRNAQIAAGQLFLLLSGAVLVVPGLRNWLGASGLRIAAAVLAVPALALLVAASGYGLYLYLHQHHHTVEHSHAGVATSEQQQWADDIQRRAWEVALKNGWFDIKKADADGFKLQWGDREHYVNREHLFDDEVLNIEKPEFLMYSDSPRGKLLVGYMFYTRSLEDRGPTPFGPLGAWHFHPWPGRGFCAIEGLLTVSRPDAAGNCAEGVRVLRSAEMFHVWLIEHPLGRFSDAMVFPAFEKRFDIAWIHPILVHFTIALFLLAVALDLFGWITRKESLHQAAFVNLICAGFITLATVAAGMAAEMHVIIPHADHDLLHVHKRFGLSVMAILAVLCLWRLWLRGRFPARAAALYMLLALGGAGLTVTAGYWGGELVYKLGVAVHATDRFVLDSYLRKVDQALGKSGVVAPAAEHHHTH